jgi:putative FmdB family regulatory protein
MPLYEYRCRECDGLFPLLRPIAEADAPAPCPDGHTDVVRALSLVAPRVHGGGTGGAAPAPSGSGGCCGGACSC